MTTIPIFGIQNLAYRSAVFYYFYLYLPPTIDEMRKRFRELIKFLTYDIWLMPPVNDKRLFYRYVVNPLRVIALTIKGFNEDKVSLKASALTYYTLWALVPIIALLIGLARGFGFQEIFENLIYEVFKNQPKMVDTFLAFAYKYLETAHGGVVLGIGIVVLLWSVINMLSNIEGTLNSIWQIKKSRTWVRKYTDYFSFFILIPVFFMLSAGTNLFIHSKLAVILQKVGIDYLVNPSSQRGADITQIVFTWILFALLYRIMPNTKVKVWPAIISGIFAGTVFQIWESLYLQGQRYLTRIDAVYGSFAAFPLFLMWLQISWVLVLFGAELSFAIQNSKNFLHHRELNNISLKYKRTLTLFICHIIVKRFISGEKPLSSHKLSEQFNLPARLVNVAINNLTESGLILEVNNGDPNESYFQPAFAHDILTLQFVNNKLDCSGESDFIKLDSYEFTKLTRKLQNIDKDFSSSKSNFLIGEL